ncbi:MAG: putative acyltransferase [Acidimicrobiaceae bacterium]|nr:putative acyltransferase [Acidimicrobiaceae bacterium]
MSESPPRPSAVRSVASKLKAQKATLVSIAKAPLRPFEALKTPTWPGTIERPVPRRNVGVDYDTSWSRTPAARLARAMIVDNLTRPFIRAVAAPRVIGAELLEPIVGPVIFAANHSSHLDTAIVLSSLPTRYRHHTVVAAAADYFFDRRWKGDLWSLTLGTIPMERSKVNRRSADLAAELIEDGWSLVIFPEGGRTEDGWGQEFRGGAAYLAKRCDVPVVPVHLHGVRPIFPKGGSRLRPGEVEVRFGAPLRPLSGEDAAAGGRDEDARRFSARVEQAVAALADEAKTDWWSARRRAATGRTPDPRGPEASPWRRAWSLPDSQRNRPVRETKGPTKPW